MTPWPKNYLGRATASRPSQKDDAGAFQGRLLTKRWAWQVAGCFCFSAVVLTLLVVFGLGELLGCLLALLLVASLLLAFFSYASRRLGWQLDPPVVFDITTDNTLEVTTWCRYWWRRRLWKHQEILAVQVFKVPLDPGRRKDSLPQNSRGVLADRCIINFHTTPVLFAADVAGDLAGWSSLAADLSKSLLGCCVPQQHRGSDASSSSLVFLGAKIDQLPGILRLSGFGGRLNEVEDFLETAAKVRQLLDLAEVLPADAHAALHENSGKGGTPSTRGTSPQQRTLGKSYVQQHAVHEDDEDGDLDLEEATPASASSMPASFAPRTGSANHFASATSPGHHNSSRTGSNATARRSSSSAAASSGTAIAEEPELEIQRGGSDRAKEVIAPSNGNGVKKPSLWASASHTTDASGGSVRRSEETRIAAVDRHPGNSAEGRGDRGGKDEKDEKEKEKEVVAQSSPLRDASSAAAASASSASAPVSASVVTAAAAPDQVAVVTVDDGRPRPKMKAKAKAHA